ncbi:hypothetical protein GCM10009860_12640 [Microbacterium mitrae]
MLSTKPYRIGILATTGIVRYPANAEIIPVPTAMAAQISKMRVESGDRVVTLPVYRSIDS